MNTRRFSMFLQAVLLATAFSALIISGTARAGGGGFTVNAICIGGTECAPRWPALYFSDGVYDDMVLPGEVLQGNRLVSTPSEQLLLAPKAWKYSGLCDSLKRVRAGDTVLCPTVDGAVSHDARYSLPYTGPGAIRDRISAFTPGFMRQFDEAVGALNPDECSGTVVVLTPAMDRADGTLAAQEVIAKAAELGIPVVVQAFPKWTEVDIQRQYDTALTAYGSFWGKLFRALYPVPSRQEYENAADIWASLGTAPGVVGFMDFYAGTSPYSTYNGVDHRPPTQLMAAGRIKRVIDSIHWPNYQSCQQSPHKPKWGWGGRITTLQWR